MPTTNAPARQRAAHLCHASGCQVAVPPRLLMCRRHWALVPEDLQTAVWATYRRGQEASKDPSAAYVHAALAAVAAVAMIEAGDQVCRVCGCTDDRACAGGCSWAGPSLCSACAAGTLWAI